MSELEKARWVQDALREHEGGLTRYAASIVGDVDRARDVVQETFMRLCAKEPAALEGKVKEWLFKVCRNRALDVQRKEHRMTPLDETTLNGEIDERRAPDKVVELKENTSRITSLLANLPPNQQEVIRLKFQNGLSYREISEVTRLSVSNVGFLIHTGLKTLRHRFRAQTKQTFERNAL